jgi:spermidine/putrescine transport system permease protein
MRALLHHHGLALSVVMLALIAFWLVMLVILPQVGMIDFAFRPFLPLPEIGGPKDIHTLENFQKLAANELHRAIFWRTIWISALVSLLTLVVCYPLAFYLAQIVTKKRLGIFLALLIIPFWINEVLRTFAWYIILSYKGPLNALLLGLGLIDEPLRFAGNSAILIGMIYAYILFMVFPLYNALESLERQQIEAARDLGASWWRVHWRVVIPHAKPGIASGTITTFMLAAGSYAVPALLGNTSSRWFTQIIYDWFFDGGNWNVGAAYALVLLILCLAFIALMLRLFKVKLGDIAR